MIVLNFLEEITRLCLFLSTKIVNGMPGASNTGAERRDGADRGAPGNSNALKRSHLLNQSVAQSRENSHNSHGQHISLEGSTASRK